MEFSDAITASASSTPILLWGLDFIRFVQTFANSQLTFFMKTITSLGGIMTFALLLPLSYWCVNEKKGMRLFVMVLISLWLNFALKFFLDMPRPFWPEYDPSVAMTTEILGGLPSIHAQNTVVMFFMTAVWSKKKWVYALAAALCFLVGFSKIYLGVHFPTDVIAGWLIGATLLCGYFSLNEKIEGLIVRGGFRAGMISTAVVSFIFIPYRPGEEMLLASSILLGIGAGYCLNRRYVGFKTALPPDKANSFKMLARFVLGIAGIALIFFFFDAIDKLLNGLLENDDLFIFTRFLLSGLWVSIAAPWVFIKLRLANAETDEWFEKDND
jgi:membrane-associated phospholipid phosphatase